MRASTLFVVLVLLASVSASAQDGQPTSTIVESPSIKVLTGLTVQQFEAEMQHFVQGVGGGCGSCHTRGNFASDANPRKATARRMIEMTKGINAQFFPDYKPADGESTLGRVTCYTCHQGSDKPKTTVGPVEASW
jgi:hypothetical protein